MAWFLYLISMILIAAGSFIILYTDASRDSVKKLLLRPNQKLLALLPATVGVLLVLAAPDSHHPVFIRILGALAMIKGAFIFLDPEKLYSKLATWYQEALSDQAHKLGGIVIVILGTAILSWIV